MYIEDPERAEPSDASTPETPPREMTPDLPQAPASSRNPNRPA